jgi:tRNA A37 N6-isopentenylltransferase MiaA
MKIEKTVVLAKSRTLKATWTVEKADDLYTEINDNLAKILQEELDREVLREVEKATLKSQGWTEVIQHTKAKISDEWCRQFIKDEYRIYSNCWYFKDERDATFFSLKWSSATQ